MESSNDMKNIDEGVGEESVTAVGGESHGRQGVRQHVRLRDDLRGQGGSRASAQADGLPRKQYGGADRALPEVLWLRQTRPLDRGQGQGGPGFSSCAMPSGVPRHRESGLVGLSGPHERQVRWRQERDGLADRDLRREA